MASKEEININHKADLEVFTLDKEVFGPESENDFHQFKHTEEIFPPSGMKDLYKKLGRQSLMKYQELFFKIAHYFWIIAILFLLILLLDKAVKN